MSHSDPTPREPYGATHTPDRRSTGTAAPSAGFLAVDAAGVPVADHHGQAIVWRHKWDAEQFGTPQRITAYRVRGGWAGTP